MTDPTVFGLPPRTVIEQVSGKHYAIIINRKSRIIMSDGNKILEKARKIKKVIPNAKVSLQTSAPVCSKTRAFLEKNEIRIYQAI